MAAKRIEDVRDEVAEELYGIGSRDRELPALELYLREQARLQAEYEQEYEGMSADPLDILLAREETGDFYFTHD